MTETGWQAIGRIARARRERLRLNQGDMANYGGPKVSTVGKFERGAQENFPLRTQHQIERALGWSRGVIEEFVDAWDQGTFDAEVLGEWEHELVADHVPDLSRPSGPQEPEDVDLEEHIQALAHILRLIEPTRRAEAARWALRALLPFLGVEGAEAAESLGHDLRNAHGLDERSGGDGDAEDVRSAAPMIGETYELSEARRTTDALPAVAHEEGDIEREQEESQESP